jgi:hypothetical protein
VADGGTGPIFLRVNEHSLSCAAPHPTHLSSAVWRRSFADSCGTGHGQSFIPRFLCGARVRLPDENGHLAEPMCADHRRAVLFLLLYRQRNEAERRLRWDGQIAVCFQNGQSQIQKFISYYIIVLQETCPTFRALKSGPCTSETCSHSDEMVITAL